MTRFETSSSAPAFLRSPKTPEIARLRRHADLKPVTKSRLADSRTLVLQLVEVLSAVLESFTYLILKASLGYVFLLVLFVPWIIILKQMKNAGTALVPTCENSRNLIA